MSTTTPDTPERTEQASTAARALAVAGDAESARDVGALDEAALAAQKRLGKKTRGLVERLIYGPLPAPAELESGGRVAERADQSSQAVVGAALDCLARGEAFTGDGKLSAALRAAVAREKAYGFTVPAEFGGAGADYAELALCEEDLAANGLGALAVEISGELTIGAGSLLGYGTGPQKSTYLPMLVEGRLMGFALTEVGVGVNAKKVRAYVEPDDATGGYRLWADGSRAKFYCTNATHGALVGLVARIGKDGKRIGLFVVELPDRDVARDAEHDWAFSCTSTEVSAFVANHNSKLVFENFPIPRQNRIEADGVEVLFYCLRMGRCMLAAMSAGYQRMLAADAAHYARLRDGVGGKVIAHELPRLNIGRMLGGALQARALSHLSLQQDADGVDLAGLRDLTKSSASGTALESQVACEHVVGGRSFQKTARISDSRANLHVFGIVEGEDDLILMGMVKDVTARFTERYMAGMLGVLQSINVDAQGQPVPREQRILRIGLGTLLREPKRGALATLRLLGTWSFWRLKAWVLLQGLGEVLRLPGLLLPASWIPRYQLLPAELRGYARWAERRLRWHRWTYLFVNLWFQLELTRAQLPLQRLGKSIEHLVSIVALCWHAKRKDATQRRVARLQCELLRQKAEGIKITTRLASIDRMRDMVAGVGGDVASGQSSLIAGVEPQPFAHPWDEGDA